MTRWVTLSWAVVAAVVSSCGPNGLRLGFPSEVKQEGGGAPRNTCSVVRRFALADATCSGGRMMCVNGAVRSATLRFGPGVVECARAADAACRDIGPVCQSRDSYITLPSGAEYRPCLPGVGSGASCYIRAESDMHIRVWDQFSPTEACGLRFDGWLKKGASQPVNSNRGMVTFDYRYSDDVAFNGPVNMHCWNGEIQDVPL